MTRVNAPSKGMRSPHGGPAAGAPRKRGDFSALGRVIGRLVRYYPVLAPVTAFCILFASVVSAIPSVFMQKVLQAIENWYESGDWATAKTEIIPYIVLLVGLYILSIAAITIHTQLMAYMTQGYLSLIHI